MGLLMFTCFCKWDLSGTIREPCSVECCKSQPLLGSTLTWYAMPILQNDLFPLIWAGSGSAGLLAVIQVVFHFIQLASCHCPNILSLCPLLFTSPHSTGANLQMNEWLKWKDEKNDFWKFSSKTFSLMKRVCKRIDWLISSCFGIHKVGLAADLGYLSS